MTEHDVTKVGLIGAGVISTVYLKTKFPHYQIVSCSDIRPEAAKLRAAQFNIEAVDTEAALSDPAIDIVLNLTIPQSHFPITQRALEAGKHVYSEKPLGLSREETEALLKTAELKTRRIGSAPDTFLGAGQQTVRKLIDEGAIGTPIGGTAFFMSSGPESWHPSPEFLYQTGGGPVFDMGPYYITSLVNLLGPVKRVFSLGRNILPKRTIGSGPRKGAEFEVEVATYVASLIEFSSGPIVTFVATFDVVTHQHAPIELYGTEGTLTVPDPNEFGGNIRLFRKGDRWREIAQSHAFGDRNYRGIGLADMSAALRAGKPHRASGQLASHVVEVLQAIVETAKGEPLFEIRSSCERPRPLQAQVPIPNFD